MQTLKGDYARIGYGQYPDQVRHTIQKMCTHAKETGEKIPNLRLGPLNTQANEGSLWDKKMEQKRPRPSPGGHAVGEAVLLPLHV